MSSTSPSLTEKPAVLWPPERQAIFQPYWRAQSMHCRMSSRTSQYAMTFGKDWKAGFDSWRSLS